MDAMSEVFTYGVVREMSADGDVLPPSLCLQPLLSVISHTVAKTLKKPTHLSADILFMTFVLQNATLPTNGWAQGEDLDDRRF